MHASCSKRPKGPKGRGEYESCDLHFAEGVSLILGAAYRLITVTGAAHDSWYYTNTHYTLEVGT